MVYNELKPATAKTRISKLKKRHTWEGKTLYAPEMEECTDDYVAYVGGIYNRCKLPKIWIELPVKMEPLTAEMFGTSDCVIIDNEDLHVVDYKHGRGVEVNAERNTQGMLYAYGVLCHLEVQMLYAPQRVTIHIFQPRAGGSSSYTLSFDELLAWIDSEVRPTVDGITSGALANEFHAGKSSVNSAHTVGDAGSATRRPPEKTQNCPSRKKSTTRTCCPLPNSRRLCGGVSC